VVVLCQQHVNIVLYHVVRIIDVVYIGQLSCITFFSILWFGMLSTSNIGIETEGRLHCIDAPLTSVPLGNPFVSIKTSYGVGSERVTANGGALSIVSSVVTIDGCIFKDLHASAYGNVIHMTQQAHVTIIGSHFTRNYGDGKRVPYGALGGVVAVVEI
jgi:hypothetical protein